MGTLMTIIWICLVTLFIVTLLVHVLTMPRKSSGQTSRINKAIDTTLRANGVRTLLHKVNFIIFLIIILAISVLAYFFAGRGSGWSIG